MAARGSPPDEPVWPADRFVDGFTHLIGMPPPEPDRADLRVDLIRGVDLVAIRLEGFGVGLDRGDPPVLRSGDDGGYLVAHHAFQHVAERAIYEEKVDPPVDDDHADPDPPSARFDPPILARPAQPSRVVFVLPAGTEIPFTTAGLLEAMTQLEMAVHPLARPRGRTFPFPDRRLIALGSGLVAVATEEGLVVGPARARWTVPDVSTPDGLVALMRDRRMARRIDARIGSVATNRAELGTGPGGMDLGARLRRSEVALRCRPVPEPLTPPPLPGYHEAVARNRRVIARLQRVDRDLPTDLGWLTVDTVEMTVRGHGSSTAEAGWVGVLTSPVDIPLRTPGGGSRWRVTVEEWELLLGDPSDLGGHTRRVEERRLVYADELTL